MQFLSIVVLRGKKKTMHIIHSRWKKKKKKKKKKKGKPTTPAVPRRSPIQVLSGPDTA